jgi:hypothetical protein
MDATILGWTFSAPILKVNKCYNFQAGISVQAVFMEFLASTSTRSIKAHNGSTFHHAFLIVASKQNVCWPILSVSKQPQILDSSALVVLFVPA